MEYNPLKVRWMQGRQSRPAHRTGERVSDGLKLAGRHLAAALVALDFEGHLLALVERTKARPFHGRDVYEHIVAAAVGLNEMSRPSSKSPKTFAPTNLDSSLLDRGSSCEVAD